MGHLAPAPPLDLWNADPKIKIRNLAILLINFLECPKSSLPYLPGPKTALVRASQDHKSLSTALEDMPRIGPTSRTWKSTPVRWGFLGTRATRPRIPGEYMTRKHSADDILQTIRDMVEDGHADMLLQWITNETFVVLTSPDSTPELRDEAWRRLEAKGYERDPDRPFSLRKRQGTNIHVKDAEEVRRAKERLDRLAVLHDGIPGELARVRLNDKTLVAVSIGYVDQRALHFQLYDNTDGTWFEVPAEKAHALAAIAHAGFVK